MKIFNLFMVGLLGLVCFIPQNIVAQEGPKEATEWTIKANQTVLADPNLKWADKKDFENAQRGFIARHHPLTIIDAKGNTIFNMEAYSSFIKPDGTAPASVNPSLWRHAQLNTFAGLFKITDRLYQIRGYDLACMTIIEGNSGYVLVDTLTTIEESKKAMELVYEKLGRKPIRAIVITHSHADHFGGIGGVVTVEQVEMEKIRIVVPAGFTKASLSENVLAGPAMGRRASFQFGVGLTAGPKGAVDAGLGKSRSGGTISFLPPTDEITETGQKMTLDGVEFIFEMSPETEAPSEMEFYLPQFKALCVAENVNQTAHNLYPMRGTLTRDAKAWAGYINQMIDLFPEAEIAFGMHFWPVWGKAEVRNWLKKQRDMYKYLHDQTLRLANLGYTGAEISQMVQLPPSLASEWFNRDYYGAIQNNVRAIYTRYLGWYDGNPANLNPLPPIETAKRLVEYMGGSDSVLTRAHQAFEAGEYRWVVQVLNLVAFADPQNISARNLEADAMEQLGYQMESSTWRNAYLLGAQELRTGKNKGPIRKTLSMYAGMAENDLLDFLTISLNGPKANGKVLSMNLVFTDRKTKYLLTLEDSVLNFFKDRQNPQADITLVGDKTSFIKLVLLGTPLDEVVQSGKLTLSGNADKFREFMGLFDEFPGDFNIVLPKK
jgi:alkyl sulfatase BDS1-like metallo-beta-lactamase superfamily hydrolase